MVTPTYISLFSGAGGGDLASQWLKGWRCVCYVERDPYAVAVLKARIRDGLLDDAPIWDDVSTFDGTAWAGLVDGLTAGFPCQPFSVAGKRRASADERNGWPDTLRLIREIQPGWCFLENVPGLLAGSHGYFGVILAELAQSGFDARWRVLSAAEVGAPHKRERLWIAGFNANFCYANRDRGSIRQNQAITKREIPQIVKSRHGWKSELGAVNDAQGFHSYPDALRVLHGIPHWMDRFATIGNGQVPLVAKTAWDLLRGEW